MQSDNSFFVRLLVAGVLISGAVKLLLLMQGGAQPNPPAAQQQVILPETKESEQPAAGPVVRHFGYEAQPRQTERFLRSMPKPTLREQAPDLIRRSSDNQPVLLYRALNEAYAWRHGGKQFVVARQEIGDCVSHGWGHGADVCLAVMWKLGETAEWHQAATEAIYGGSRVEARGVSQGGWGDGSYGAAAAKWVRDWGIVFRQPYEDLGLDLSTYSGTRAKQWGNYGCGGQGDNGRLDNIAKTHPVRNVALVSTFAEAAAAIQSGYPVPVCSGYGFTDQRDSQGFCRQSGRWAHCMCFIGVRFGDRAGLLCLNSWGPNWVSGPKWPEDQPDGSFWVDANVAEGMLSGRDSFAVSGYEGFPYRDLKHGDWVEVRPAKVRTLQAELSNRFLDPEYALAP